MHPQPPRRRASAPANLPRTPKRLPRPYPLNQKALYAQARQIDKEKKRGDHDRLVRVLNKLIERYNDKATPEAQPWDHTEIVDAAKKAEALRVARDAVNELSSDEEAEEAECSQER